MNWFNRYKLARYHHDRGPHLENGRPGTATPNQNNNDQPDVITQDDPSGIKSETEMKELYGKEMDGAKKKKKNKCHKSCKK
jgi:hypothetical protein